MDFDGNYQNSFFYRLPKFLEITLNLSGIVMLSHLTVILCRYANSTYPFAVLTLLDVRTTN